MSPSYFTFIIAVLASYSTFLNHLKEKFEIGPEYGKDLYINILSYLTSTHPHEKINDNEFKILNNDVPSASTGTFYENCHSSQKYLYF